MDCCPTLPQEKSTTMCDKQKNGREYCAGFRDPVSIDQMTSFFLIRIKEERPPSLWAPRSED